MKKLFSLLFLCVSAVVANAQSAGATEGDNGIFRPNHYSFELANTWYAAPNITNVFPGQAPYLSLKPSASAYGAFSYSHIWPNGFGIKTGIRIGVISVAAAQHLPANGYYNNELTPWQSFYSPFPYYQFPVCGVYRIHFKDNFNLDFSTGLMLDLVLSSGFSSSNEGYAGNGNSYSTFELDLNTNSRAAYLEVPFEITASKVFKGKKELDFGLTYCMPFKNIGYGQYYYNVYNYNSGNFAIRNEYVGVKVGYTFLARARRGTSIDEEFKYKYPLADERRPRKALVFDTLYHPDHYSISMTPTWYFKPHTTINAGTLPALAQGAPSIQFGFAYERLWPKGFGFKVGAAWGLTAFRLSEGRQPGPDSLAYTIAFSNYFNYFEFPFCAVGRINLSKKYKLDFATGVVVDVTLAINGAGEGTGAGVSNSPPYNLTPPDINMTIQTKSIPVTFGLPLEITCARVLQGKQEIDFGFSGALALGSPVLAQYTAATTTASGSGGVHVRNSYLGIKVAYTLLGGAKKWGRKHG